MFFSPRSEGDHQLFLMPSVILSPLFAVNRSLPNHAAAIREGSGTAGRRIGSRVALNVLLILTLAGFTSFLTINYDKRAKGTDFPDFYTAARMVRDGYGHQLYDFKAQDRFQTVYAGRTGTYYIHPPFETLLYLPISLWSLQTAYLLWCIFNVAVLATPRECSNGMYSTAWIGASCCHCSYCSRPW